MKKLAVMLGILAAGAWSLAPGRTAARPTPATPRKRSTVS
jgi:hypothetical protein